VSRPGQRRPLPSGRGTALPPTEAGPSLATVAGARSADGRAAPPSTRPAHLRQSAAGRSPPPHLHPPALWGPLRHRARLPDRAGGGPAHPGRCGPRCPDRPGRPRWPRRSRPARRADAARSWSCPTRGTSTGCRRAGRGRGPGCVAVGRPRSGERYRRWLSVLRGEVRVAVGTRATAFAPVREPRAGGGLGRR
jgi:primosomal protein N' (replication factor Y)